MDRHEFGSLFSAIDAHLCTRRAETRCCAAQAYWHAHPVITRAEIALLAELTCTPATEQEIVDRMGVDVCTALKVIDAMVAIGVLEPHGSGFRASPAAAMYCRSLQPGMDGTEQA
jgi:hypothetical protein